MKQTSPCLQQRYPTGIDFLQDDSISYGAKTPATGTYQIMKVALYEQNEKPSSALEEDLAELIQVSWLEITGSYELELKKTYEVGFKVSYTPEAFGWNGCPVYVMAKFGKKGKYIWKRAKLTDKAEKMPFEISEQALRITSDTENTLYFGLYEVWSGKWKGGLKIHEAFIKKVDT
ncbi:protein PHLOEM PROTEIN 2-LIKE A9-like isoform X3 [Alnus glutinosa]|uniref:protein PHLOEM PROTEIN 2-LIKE A9-like isoform X3 n=1 Tax=Alnus glutinosa TaxID=3517 RepID=UPI002D774795|nr:protein PHLOEM PROTEIN 2-LIKE A9-like isoform X3 [Alnus glutinosa]